MKKIRTIGEIEAITRFMYEAYRSKMLQELDYDSLGDYEDLDGVEHISWNQAVKSLLNHLEIVNELELGEKS